MLTESAIEAFAIKLLERQGFTYVHGPALAPEGEQAERTHYGEVMLGGRLAQTARRINHRLPTEVVDLAVKEVLRAGSSSSAHSVISATHQTCNCWPRRPC